MIDNSQAKVLMQQAKQGDEAAFALLYENFYTPIFRYIYSKVGQREMAEDMAQTVFMKAFQSRESFSVGPTPIAYFFTIARNLVIDHYRKKSEVLIDNQEDGQDMFSQIPDEEMNPHDRFLDSEKIGFIQNLIHKLKPEYKEVIEMKFLQQLSNKEIAEATGKSEQNIRQIQVRALRKLKELLT